MWLAGTVVFSIVTFVSGYILGVARLVKRQKASIDIIDTGPRPLGLKRVK